MSTNDVEDTRAEPPNSTEILLNLTRCTARLLRVGADPWEVSESLREIARRVLDSVEQVTSEVDADDIAPEEPDPAEPNLHLVQ